MNKILFFLEKYLAAFLVLILGITYRIRTLSVPPEGRYIFIFWHRNMIPLLYKHRFEQKVIMISNSKDGELIAGPAEALGFVTARGSSRKGSTAALREMIRLAKDHSLAITPDGPKGPCFSIRPGLINLASMTGLQIIPVAVDIGWEKVFNSWDRFRLPLPFTRINISYGEPLAIDKKKTPGMIEKLGEAMDILDENNKIER